MKMNSTHFVTNIFIPLEQAIFPRGRAPHQNRLVVHLENCSVHKNPASTNWLEEHGICRMLYQPYSSDLAPCDFYFFPMKERLERIQVADRDPFFEFLQGFWAVWIKKN
jgi:hypothetical protein